MEEHLDEGGFLFLHWQRALASPSYVPSQVTEGPEERLRAHVDGLLVGGVPLSERLLQPALEGERQGRQALAALVLLKLDGDRYLRDVLDATSADASHPVAHALGLSLAEEPALASSLLSRLPTAPAGEQAVALAAFAFRRLTLQAALHPFLREDDPDLVAAALNAGRRDVALPASLFEHHLRSLHPGLFEAAAMGGLLRGSSKAWAAILERASTSPFALQMIATLGRPEERASLLPLLQTTMRTSAVWCMGVSGDTRFADPLMELMADPDLQVASLAAEAFSTITGLSITGAFAREAQGVDDLPWPFLEMPLADPELVARWWYEARSGLSAPVRYLAGVPVGDEPAGLMSALVNGPTRLRFAHACELAVRTRGALDLCTEDWMFLQLATLQRGGSG